MEHQIQSAIKNNAVAQTGTKTLQSYLTKMKSEIAKALPSVLTPERFTRVVMTAISSNPKLAECSPDSFLGAMMTAAQLGLEPNTPLGQAYLIPYGKQCQFQLGYRGMLDLAYRSGEVTTIQAHVVYENDEFRYAYGLEPVLTHIPVLADRGEPTYVYAVFKKKDGGYGFEVMSMTDVRAHAKKYSKTYGSGPWQTNFEEMAKKTVLKALLKYAPMKSDFVRGVASDHAIRTELAEDMTQTATIYVDAETGEVTTEEAQNAK